MTASDHPSAATPPTSSASPAPPQQLTELPLDFQGFHQLHRPAYIHWAETWLGSRCAAEEAVDQAFEQLARTWNDVLQKENPNAWAWKVMRNRTMELATPREGDRLPLLGPEVFEAIALLDSTDPIGQFEDTVALHQAIRQLTDRQQDVVVLRFFRGYTSDQVADHLGVTPAGVRSTVRHAKSRLRELLAPAEGDTDDRP